MDVFWTLPPVSRTITAATVVFSALGHAGIIDLVPLVFIPELVLQIPPQLWRVFTSFLITGPGFSIILDPYLLYNYGSNLEKNSQRFSRPGDFFTYVAFVSLFIVGTSGIILGGFVFLPALTLAFAYTFAQENPSQQVSIFILTFPAKFLPLAMLFMTFVMGGPGPTKQQATGLLAAHAYDFLTRIWPELGGGRRWIKTPAIVAQWFGANNPAPVQRTAGTAFPARTPPSQQPSQPNRAWTSGFGRPGGGSGNWNNFGSGRRLGGD